MRFLFCSSDNDLRAQIQSADDLLVERPILPPRIVGFHSLEQALMLPSYVDPSMHPVPSEIKEMLASVCRDSQ
jgi:hypothetical protein